MTGVGLLWSFLERKQRNWDKVISAGSQYGDPFSVGTRPVERRGDRWAWNFQGSFCFVFMSQQNSTFPKAIWWALSCPGPFSPLLTQVKRLLVLMVLTTTLIYCSSHVTDEEPGMGKAGDLPKLGNRNSLPLSPGWALALGVFPTLPPPPLWMVHIWNLSSSTRASPGGQGWRSEQEACA